MDGSRRSQPTYRHPRNPLRQHQNPPKPQNLSPVVWTRRILPSPRRYQERTRDERVARWDRVGRKSFRTRTGSRRKPPESQKPAPGVRAGHEGVGHPRAKEAMAGQLPKPRRAARARSQEAGALGRNPKTPIAWRDAMSLFTPEYRLGHVVPPRRSVDRAADYLELRSPRAAGYLCTH